MVDVAFDPRTIVTPTPRQSASYHPLTETQILDFYHEIDTESRGYVTLGDLEEKLEQILGELSPSSNLARHLPDLRPRRLDDIEEGANSWLQPFLQDLFPNCDYESKILKDDFVARVRSWCVPFPSLSTATGPQPRLVERLWARWEVEGPRIAFTAFIVALQVALGLWQMIKFIQSPLDRSAFGWGVILSKCAAGAIYPTFFFLLLSMSRYFATLMRRFKHVPRLLNWDRSQSTHVWMGIAGLGLATLHAIGYLTGSFIHGSEPAHQSATRKFFQSDEAPRSYVQFLRLLPGWTGMTALGLYWIIAILSLPIVRSRSWETFQLGHILMFPMLALLCAHGSLAILEKPLLGYWLAFPLFLVLLERSSRLAHGCRKVVAYLDILDEHTVSLSFEHPRGNWWNYEAGQYIFIQVPSISFFQWHPFTISSCNGKLVQVHIQTGGNWTRRLRSLPTERPISIGVDGPFGAPSQRVYEFDRAVILGAGVGITPFSAIMTDIEQKLVSGIDPWAQVRRNDGLSRSDEKAIESGTLPASLTTPRGSVSDVIVPRAKRRVDFHWIVREREDLLWFSTLLNRAHDLSQALPASSLELNINTYITNRHKDLSAYVFRYLLDGYRPPDHPYSPLTGLKMRSKLGRPDLGSTLLELHNELKQKGWTGGRVGVFFCGNSHIGRLLAEACTQLTSKAQKDGSKIRYIFIMEVFG